MPATFPDPVRGRLDYELTMLGRYIKTSEEGLMQAGMEEKAVLDAKFSKVIGGTALVMSTYMGHAVSFQEEFPMVMRYGHVTSIYSVAEYGLRTLCKNLCENRKSITIHVSDLKRYPYIDASKVFLTKVVDAEVSDWSPIDLLSDIRNCIVHCNGFDRTREVGPLES